MVPPRRVVSCAVSVPFGDRIRTSMRNSHLSIQDDPSDQSLTLLVIVWVLVVIALARPQWLEEPVTKNLPTRDLLLLVDLSGSMRQEDFTSQSGKRVDRLTAVKQVLGDFLVRREGDRVGLVVFGDAPFLQAPFSDDLELSRQLLDETAIGMAGPKTAFGDAIGLGISMFDVSDAPAKTIIALTDGNDTASHVPPAEASRVARERDIRIHTVAIGDPTTVGEDKLDESTLRDVASNAGGSYFFAADREELAGIYADLDRIETRQVSVISHRTRRELYYWPLLAVMALWMGANLLSTRRTAKVLDPKQTPTSIQVDAVTGELRIRS
jgi:Ca-activated chloride channel homolog